MSFVVPWDGVHRIQSVAYPEQKVGLRFHSDIIVAGRHESSPDPRIEWEIQATSIGDWPTNCKITIRSNSDYIGVDSDSEKVVYNATPYEWDISYREVGKWIIRDTSGLLMYLPNGDDGAEVKLTRDGAGDVSYWRFIPIRPPSN